MGEKGHCRLPRDAQVAREELMQFLPVKEEQGQGGPDEGDLAGGLRSLGIGDEGKDFGGGARRDAFIAARKMRGEQDDLVDAQDGMPMVGDGNYGMSLGSGAGASGVGYRDVSSSVRAKLAKAMRKRENAGHRLSEERRGQRKAKEEELLQVSLSSRPQLPPSSLCCRQFSKYPFMPYTTRFLAMRSESCPRPWVKQNINCWPLCFVGIRHPFPLSCTRPPPPPSSSLSFSSFAQTVKEHRSKNLVRSGWREQEFARRILQRGADGGDAAAVPSLNQGDAGRQIMIGGSSSSTALCQTRQPPGTVATHKQGIVSAKEKNAAERKNYFTRKNQLGKSAWGVLNSGYRP
jgi:hypothetical protein